MDDDERDGKSMGGGENGENDIYDDDTYGDGDYNTIDFSDYSRRGRSSAFLERGSRRGVRSRPYHPIRDRVFDVFEMAFFVLTVVIVALFVCVAAFNIQGNQPVLFGLPNPFYSEARGGADAEMSDAQKKVREIISVLDANYLNEYDKSRALDAMYEGLVASIGDPYTVYMGSERFLSFLEDTEGSYSGIGIQIAIDPDDSTIVVHIPFEGSPAQIAGVLPGDKIMRVNNSDITGLDLDDVVSMVKGEPGTEVNLTIYRPSSKEFFDLALIRGKINIPTVSGRMMDDDIAYIRITQFDRVTYDQFKSIYDRLSPDMKGLILDLRNNPGGLLHVVCNITDMLVPEGPITYTEDKNGKKSYTYSDSNRINVPMLVLINGNSASASEVLTGAVKDYGVAELVGTTTYGKGIVQSLFPLSDKISAIKITVAKYYTPSGVCIQGTGIDPTYEIDMDNELSVRISSLTLEEDIQLQKAVEIMEGKIK